MTSPPRPGFATYGVEIEYMIVDASSFEVRAIADELLRDAAGASEYVSDYETGDAAWSNELVAHVVEMKTATPATSLAPLSALFAVQVRHANELLARRGARLMPGGMHPWMDPHSETKLWPHDCGDVYAQFDRIFDCRGHGWSNLQSVHLNLPFANDDEFARLHAAVRLVLPLLPALAAASPIADGRVTGQLDTRLRHYCGNSRRVASVAGQIVPESVFTQAAYRTEILERIYSDLAPYDPEGVLRHEWVNARGAIARFDRGTIEIRVLDSQECPAADLAIVALTAATIRALMDERWCPHSAQQDVPTEPLAELFQASLVDGERAIVQLPALLRAFGLRESVSLGDLWRHVADALRDWPGRTGETDRALAVILNQGPLARRLLAALRHAGVDVESAAASGVALPREPLRAVYARLCDCLPNGESFTS